MFFYNTWYIKFFK